MALRLSGSAVVGLRESGLDEHRITGGSWWLRSPELRRWTSSLGSQSLVSHGAFAGFELPYGQGSFGGLLTELLGVIGPLSAPR